MAVTGRHPHWPGVLVAVENEYELVCDRSLPGGWGGSLQQVGHIIAAQARSAPHSAPPVTLGACTPPAARPPC